MSSGVLFRFFRPFDCARSRLCGACSSLLVTVAGDSRPFGFAQRRLWAAFLRSFGASFLATAGAWILALAGASLTLSGGLRVVASADLGWTGFCGAALRP